MPEFRGSYTVMVTPFREDGGGIDEAATRRFVRAPRSPAIGPC